tara:strand:+ start:3562 stop:4440 length:879 start_codon:yes stop_codon:yes gene_type:complete
MNKDQNLIFEAYTQTLTEGWEAGTSKAPKGKSYDMSRGGAPSNVDAARDGSGGRYRKTRPPSAQSNKTHGEGEEYDNDELMVNGVEYIVQAEISGDDVEITTLFKYDAELDDHIEVDLDSISPQLRQDIEDSVQNDAGRENNLENTPLEELSTLTPAEYEIAKTFETFDDDDWYESKRQKLFFRKREGGEDNESREKSIMRGREAASAEQEIFYKEHGADAFEAHYGFEYPEEDESLGDSSNFEDKAEKFAGVIGDIELEYLVNLSSGQFEILKGFLQDEMGYRDLGQYKRN